MLCRQHAAYIRGLKCLRSSAFGLVFAVCDILPAYSTELRPRDLILKAVANHSDMVCLLSPLTLTLTYERSSRPCQWCIRGQMGLFSFLLHKTTPCLHTRSVIDSSNFAFTDLIPIEDNHVCFRFLSILLTKCVKLTRVCLCARSVLKLLTVFRKKTIGVTVIMKVVE
jgi:hypothetical protein